MVNYPQQVPFQRLLVRFISTSTPIERHLLAGKQLTDTERDLIYNTVLILHAALEVWQKKRGRSPRKPPSDH
ncbi:MAG: hypothetical protein A4E19_17870 [Nitrospira sp. SG-bin1]|nr:MAG: hypothetical protein A4E19_17870 [Nitrospira sp. SG-bin1]